MWLEKITPKNLKENNPLIREKILDIQKTAKHPIIIIMGASGVGKDTIINELLKNNPAISRIKRVTSREKKERDQEWDFEYLTPKEMEEKIQTGDVLFAYDSHRKDGSKYGMIYKEIKKLENHPLVTVMGQWGLDIRSHVPIIVCTLTRNEWDIVDALSTRKSDKQTQKNISETNKNLVRFLDKPLYSQIIIENKTNNVAQTVSEIEDAIKYFQREIQSTKPDILNKIFNTNIIDYVNAQTRDLSVFKDTLRLYLKNGKEEIDQNRVRSLVQFMYTRKFSKISQYLTFIRDYENIKNKKGILKERKTFYKETAKLLYSEWFHEEAHKIMLQIWETEEPFSQEIAHNNIEHTDNIIGISQCLDNLWARYVDSYIEGHKITFYHNGYAWWRNASKLAKETLNMLLNTKNIEIKNSTSMRGNFNAKLLKPYNWIEEIECQIIKDKV